MRRTTILMALVALMVALFATAAYAAATAIYGTDGDDYVINESSGGWVDDRIYALDGDDYINAVVGWSTTRSDTDKLFGGKGDDILGADDGDGADLLNGGPGYDECYGTQGDHFANCEEISTNDY